MLEKICKNPNCIHKGQLQPIKNFAKRSKAKDGYNYICKDCQREENKQNNRKRKNKRKPSIKEKTCSNKNCIHGDQKQPIRNFHNKMYASDGLESWCKDCISRYQKERRVKNKQSKSKLIPLAKNCTNPNCPYKGVVQLITNFYQKFDGNYLSWCKECVKSNKKQYAKESPGKIKEQCQNWNNKYAKFSTYSQKLESVGFITRIDPNNSELLQVQCANCEQWFNPINKSVRGTLSAVNGYQSQGALYYLYCSEMCKNSCPVYHTIKYRKDNKPVNDSRDGYIQTQIRDMILERDNYTCQKCGRQPSKSELICHHIDPIVNNPVESADVDNCITLCKKCDDFVHSLPGCKRVELKCS